MEAVFLLCSIVSTFVASSLLSLVLALRSLPLLLRRGVFGCGDDEGRGEVDDAAAAAVLLYEGRVRHTRRRPALHSFEYPVRYALIDLDRAPQPSHLSAGRAREVAGTDGKVFLLTIPASVGYEENPLSVYYCYDVSEDQEKEEGEPPSRLKMCIAEVTNTPWGERVSFLFSPGSDVIAKPLHVSPFMDMEGNWTINAKAPAEDLSLVISVQHPTLGNYFTATLRAKRVYSSSNSVGIAMYFWLMPHKVSVWIYWQALKLWWKNVKFLSHPKYLNPRYRDDASLRNRELCQSKCTGRSHDSSICHTSKNREDRWCMWREAPWPWS